MNSFWMLKSNCLLTSSINSKVLWLSTMRNGSPQAQCRTTYYHSYYPSRPLATTQYSAPQVYARSSHRNGQRKLTYGILEPSQGPYRSRYFLVVKQKPGDW